MGLKAHEHNTTIAIFNVELKSGELENTSPNSDGQLTLGDNSFLHRQTHVEHHPAYPPS